jgi:hypothetical protein
MLYNIKNKQFLPKSKRLKLEIFEANAMSEMLWVGDISNSKTS